MKTSQVTISSESALYRHSSRVTIQTKEYKKPPFFVALFVFSPLRILFKSDFCMCFPNLNLCVPGG